MGARVSVGDLLGLVGDRAQLGRVNTTVDTSNPRSFRYAVSRASSIRSRERILVSKRTLPVLMCVATSEKPAASVAATMSALGNFRVGPRLIARRNPR